MVIPSPLLAPEQTSSTLDAVSAVQRRVYPLVSGYTPVNQTAIARQYKLLDAQAKIENPELYALEVELNRKGQVDLSRVPVVAQWDMVADDALEDLVQEQLAGAYQASLALRQIPLQRRIEVLQEFGNRLSSQFSKWRDLTIQEYYAYETFSFCFDATLNIFQPSYFDFIEPILKPQWKAKSDTRLEYVPQGVIGVISPQNSSFPILTQVIHGAFLAGNALLIKPPHRLAIVAMALVEEFNQVLKDCGMPDRLLNTVVHPNTQRILDAWLGLKAKRQRINNLVFIGNSQRRNEVVQSCQQAGICNPIIELEGVDAAYIHSDINESQLQQLAYVIAHAKNLAAGQFCISLRRLLVHPDIYESFMTHLRQEFKRYRPGSLLSDDPFILGPSTLPHKLRGIIQSFNQLGARVTVGGRRLNYLNEPDPEGIYIEPTIIEGVEPGCELLQNEIFANVLPVIKTDGSLKQAIEEINNCPFGIRASIFAQDPAAIAQLRHSLNVGTVIINSSPLTSAIHIAGGRGMTTLDQHARIWPIDLSLRQVVTNGESERLIETVLKSARSNTTFTKGNQSSPKDSKIHMPDRY